MFRSHNTTFAPNATGRHPLASPLISIAVTPSELRQLITGLEVQAAAAADIGFDTHADLLLLRIVTLRDAAR